MQPDYLLYAVENLSSAVQAFPLFTIPPSRCAPALLYAALLSDFICCHNSLNTVASVNQRTAQGEGGGGGVVIKYSKKKVEEKRMKVQK